jgi:hypothetical protein
MRFFCQKGLFLIVALTTACHETTAPPITGFYILESINSQPLPANIQAEAGDTITVLASWLSLDPFGRAQLFELIRYVHPNSPPGEASYTSNYSYRIIGNAVVGQRIEFDFSPPCPPNALCAVLPVGMIDGSKLILSYGSPPSARPPSVYRREDSGRIEH